MTSGSMGAENLKGAKEAGARAPALTGRIAALALAGVAVAILAGVWAMQLSGYAPCELCYKERWAWYATLPLALVAGALDAPRLRRALLALIGLALLANAGLGIYHFGVEAHWWQGPTGCTGIVGDTNDVNAFLASLKKTAVVRCDAPALKVLGLSLAAWNALVSAALAAFAGAGAAKKA